MESENQRASSSLQRKRVGASRSFKLPPVVADSTLEVKREIVEIAQRTDGREAVKVMTFNVRADNYIRFTEKLHRNNQRYNWTFRFTKVIKEIKKFDPDVIFFQEANKLQFRYVVESLPDYTFRYIIKYVAHVAEYNRDGCAIAIKEKESERFRNLKSTKHYFKNINIARRLGLDSLYGKVNVALSIEAELENESIYFGNVHLSSGSESNEYTRRARLFQMQKFCDRFLHDVTSSAPRVVICSDLNSAPYSKMYRYLMRPSEQDEDLDKVGKINYNLSKMVSAYGRVMNSSLFTEEVSDLREKLVNNELLTHIYGGRSIDNNT